MQISSSGHPIARNLSFEKMFSELYDSYWQELYKYALRLVQYPYIAEDVCQDVFLKLLSSKDKCAVNVKNYRSFLLRMVHNEAIDYLRRKKSDYLLSQDIRIYFDSPHNLTDEMIFQKEMEANLQQAIQKLSPQKRKVYVLRRMEGLPLETIAVLLNVSLRTVKNMMTMANEQVRDYINQQMGTDHKRKYHYNKVKKAGFIQLKSLKAA